MAHPPEKKDELPIKLVVYDFDQTISCDHIYHKLDGMAKLRTGQGQLDELKGMSKDTIIDTFGGKDRISRLSLHFERVRSSADVAIVSFGYVKVIKQCLEITNLSQYFENMAIIGSDSEELKDVHGSKAQCIQNMKKSRKIKSAQVLFVDDDATNIRKAKQTCKTLEITPRNGMSHDHMKDVEQTIGVYEIEKKENDTGNDTGNDSVENDKSSNNSSQNSSSNSNDSSNLDNSNNTNNDNNNGNGNNNNNNVNINNNGNNNGNDNMNNIANDDDNADDSKEPNTNRQSSLKEKFAIDDNKSKLLDKLLSFGNDDSEGTPVVDVGMQHESDSETNDNGDNFVLTTPVLPNVKD